MTPSKTEHELKELLRADLTKSILEGTDPDTGDLWFHRDDAEKVVAAVNALPALLAERKRLREELSALAAAVEAIPGGAIATTPARVLLGQRAVDYEQDLIDAANAEVRSLLAEQEATDER